MYGTVRVNCMTLCGGAVHSLHDWRGSCTIPGRGSRFPAAGWRHFREGEAGVLRGYFYEVFYRNMSALSARKHIFGILGADSDILKKYCIVFAQIEGAVQCLPFEYLRVNCDVKFPGLAGAADSNCSEDSGRLLRDDTPR